MQQQALFAPELPSGMRYAVEFLSEREERELLERVQALPLQEAQYRQFTAKRRTVNYGSSYDFAAHASQPAPPSPSFLDPLRDRIAAWSGLPPAAFVHALIAEYRPGAPLGWHRDVPEFEAIVGVSLASAARMRFRPYPWTAEKKAQVFSIEVEPRSVYLLQGEARWRWQHSVPPVKTLRYSVTFRTRRSASQHHQRLESVSP